MLTLVIGGAASGKSAFAESLCMQSPLPRTYLATMQVWDAECAARVARHRAMRQQKQFATVECPRGLEAIALPQRGTVLLEDLGNLAANELYDPAGAGEAAADVVLRGIEVLRAQCEELILVTNEVFSGGYRAVSAHAGQDQQCRRPARRHGRAGRVRHSCLL
jgi:adenosylcobinamide kinase/adenosylcobinamide-phosphate guanylyltransferase